MRSFKELFQSYTKAHGEYVLNGTVKESGKKDGTGYTKPGPITNEMFEKHLSGKGNGVGAVPLLDDNEMVWWGCIDIDEYNLDLVKLEKDIEDLPLVLTASKSKGGHLWLFFKEPVPAKFVMERLREWAAALGYSKPGQEIFPKQGKRINAKDVGNWINLPYYGETRRAIIDGKEATLEQFLELATKCSLTLDDFKKIKVTADTDGMFNDGPPCLGSLVRKGGLGEGGRNNALVNYALYFMKKFPDEWRERTLRFNKEFVTPPLEESAVNATMDSVQKKAYNYTCKKQPLEAHCNRAVCVKREFGVASGADNEELNVGLSNLVKFNSTPPIYQITLDDDPVNLSGSHELLDQKKIAVLCFEVRNRVMKKVSQKKWDGILQELLDSQTVIDVPNDASICGQFMQHFQGFVDKKRSEEKDRMAAGNVWYDEKNGTVYFSSLSLMNYLRHEGFRDLDNAEVFRILKDRGGSHGRFNIKGKTITWWSCPFSSIQTEEYNTPGYGGDVFGGDSEPSQEGE